MVGDINVNTWIKNKELIYGKSPNEPIPKKLPMKYFIKLGLIFVK
jgi:hypothetical protein